MEESIERHNPRPAEVSIPAFSQVLRSMSDLYLSVFKLPLELFLEIFSHLRHYQDAFRYIGPVNKVDVERSTITRRLTMTCWTLRNILLPVLWKDTEACAIPVCPDEERTYGLYPQCEYLLSNPIVAAYVQCVHSCFAQKQRT